ncbi:MAG: hypothetical protein R3B70_37550 [Polyangiaceae bacterium]
MSFAVVWHRPALFTLRELPMHTAMVVDRAILRFAETGTGHLEWDPPYHRLRAGLHDAVLTIDTEARKLTVLRIYRMR